MKKIRFNYIEIRLGYTPKNSRISDTKIFHISRRGFVTPEYNLIEDDQDKMHEHCEEGMTKIEEEINRRKK